MAHITGGGLRNLIRLNRGVGFRIDSPLEPQQIFKVIKELGGITDIEMYQTFNMGMGFCLIAPREEVDSILSTLDGKIEAKVVGSVEKGHGVTCPPLDLIYEKY